MTVVAAERQPVSCTLPAGEFEDRTTLIADLNRNALLSQSRDGLRLRSTYAGHAASAIDELVRRERECCAFLAFNISQTGQSVTMTIDVPDKWRESERESKRPSRMTLVAMGTFTAVLLLTVGSPILAARVLSLVS